MSSWMTGPQDTSEVIDLAAICSRPTKTPVRDLTPPDLRSMGAFTTDLGDETANVPRPRAQSPKRKIAIVGVASAVLAVLAIVTVVATRHAGASTLRQPSVAAKVPPSPATTAPPAPEPPAKTVTAPAAPPASNVKLPPPPTTGATTVANAPPPRAFRSNAAAKPAAPPAAGPKMTKIQSTGVPAR